MILQIAQGRICFLRCALVVLLGLSWLSVPIHAARQKKGTREPAAHVTNGADYHCGCMETEQPACDRPQHTTVLGAIGGAGSQQHQAGVQQKCDQDGTNIRVLCYNTNGCIDAVGMNGHMPTAADLAACQAIYSANNGAGANPGKQQNSGCKAKAQRKQHAAQQPMDTCYMPPSQDMANQQGTKHQGLAQHKGAQISTSEYTANDIIAISSVWMMALLFIYCCATRASKHWRKLGNRKGRKMPGNANSHHAQRTWFSKSILVVYRFVSSPMLQSVSVLGVLTAACFWPTLMVCIKGFAAAALTGIILHCMFNSLVAWMYYKLPAASSVGHIAARCVLLPVSLLKGCLWTIPVTCISNSCYWCVGLLQTVRKWLLHGRVSVIVTADSLDGTLSEWSTSTLQSGSSGSSSSNASIALGSSFSSNASRSRILRRNSSSLSRRGSSHTKQQRQQQQQQQHQQDENQTRTCECTFISSRGSKPAASPKSSKPRSAAPLEQPSNAAASLQCKPAATSLTTGKPQSVDVSLKHVTGSSSSNCDVCRTAKQSQEVISSPQKAPPQQQQRRKQERQSAAPTVAARQQQRCIMQNATHDAATCTSSVAANSSSNATVNASQTAADVSSNSNASVNAAHAAAAAAMTALPSPVADVASSSNSSSKRDQDSGKHSHAFESQCKQIGVMQRTAVVRVKPSPPALSLALQDDKSSDQQTAPATDPTATTSSSSSSSDIHAAAAAAAATAAMHGCTAISPTILAAAPKTPVAAQKRGSSSSGGSKSDIAAAVSPPSTPLTPTALPAGFLAFAGSSSSSAVDSNAVPAVVAAASSSVQRHALQPTMSPCKDSMYNNGSSSSSSSSVKPALRPGQLLPPGYAAAAAAAAADFEFEPSAVHNAPLPPACLAAAAAAQYTSQPTSPNAHLAAMQGTTACIGPINAPSEANAQQQSPYVLFADSAPPLQAALAAVAATDTSAAATPFVLDPPLVLTTAAAAAAAVAEPVVEPQRPDLYAGLQHCIPPPAAAAAAAARATYNVITDATTSMISSGSSSSMGTTDTAARVPATTTAAAARPPPGPRPSPFSSAAAAIAAIASAAQPATPAQQTAAATAAAGTNALPATLQPSNASSSSSSSGGTMHSVIWSVVGSTVPPMLPILPAFVPPTVGGIVQQLSQQLSGWLSTDSAYKLLPGDLFAEDDDNGSSTMDKQKGGSNAA